MTENEKKADPEPEVPSVDLPPRPAFPPPPEVNYSRPGQNGTGSGADGKPSSGTDLSSHVASHGAGLAAGITFVTSIIAGALLGSWIDSRWNHTRMPWGTMIMTLVGAAAGFINMMRLMARSGRKK